MITIPFTTTGEHNFHIKPTTKIKKGLIIILTLRFQVYCCNLSVELSPMLFANTSRYRYYH